MSVLLWLVAFRILGASTHAYAESDGLAEEPDTEEAVSHGTEGDADPAGYRAVVDEALREYGAGNFEEAKSLFLRAHVLFPNARTHRGIGKAEFELRDYPACIAQLEEALRSDVRPLDAAVRSDVEKLLVRARGFVAALLIDTKPAASEILIDGVPALVTPGTPLVLNAGNRLIETRAQGYAPEKRRISAKGGQRETLTIVFGTPLSSAETSEGKRRWYKSPWLWSAVVAVVAGGATAGVFAIRAHAPERTGTDAYVVTR